MLRYNITDFNRISKNMPIQKLDNEIIEILNIIKNQLSIQDTNKNQLFKNNNYELRNKKKDINDWELMRGFNKTELKKVEGIESNIQVIRKYLNMIADNTYDIFKNNIFEEIELVNMNFNNEFQHFTNEIYYLVSTNFLYSEIYAKLYKELINKYSIFNDILEKELNNFNEIFNDIKYYNPDTEYDKFCENNKLNDKRRAKCNFYVNLFKENIISYDTMSKNILYLIDKNLEYIKLKDKQNEVDEISELIYILVSNLYSLIDNESKDISKNIYEKIYNISLMKISQETSITNKCIFKYMDILDDIS